MSKIIASNHKGYRDYSVIESLECGIELKGGEVKSIRQARVNLNDSFARIDEGELFLYNTHISPYAEASYMNVEPTRKRRLLLHKKQLEKLAGKLSQKSLTLIPLKVYFNDRGYVKLELALCKGKKLYDKRDDVKRREADIAVRRALHRKR